MDIFWNCTIKIITFILLIGGEYPAVVEYAPYQAVPKKKVKKDPKIGTILEGVQLCIFNLSLTCMQILLCYHLDP